MADKVRMTSKTVFANERITVFRKGGPAEGIKGEAATIGDEFETDVLHARELHAAGIADPLKKSDLEGEAGPLEPHYQVSVPQLAASQSAHGAPAEPAAKADGGVVAAGLGAVGGATTAAKAAAPASGTKAKPARAG